MEIANMAILMTAGAETTSTRTPSGDSSPAGGEADGLSFAKSFNERVGEAIFSSGEKPVKGESIAAQGPVSGVPVKLDGGKGSTIATHEKNPGGKLAGSITVNKNPAPQETGQTQPQTKITSGD